MPYCPNCGGAVEPGDRFCANCGTALQTVPQAVSASTGARSDYRIVLVSRGTCSRAVAIDMLSDLLGYSDADAARLIDNAPIETARGLTAIQAQYVSQAITEYGMQVAIYNSDGYVDMGSRATTSVYNSDGSFLSAVAGVLTGLAASNRISTFDRWTKPAPVVFMPAYRRPAPPPAYRRRRPAPRPAPIPVVHHAPPPRPTPAPRPAPTPSRAVSNSRPVTTPRPAPAPHHPAPANRPTPNPVPQRHPGPQRGPGGAGRNGRGGPGGGPRGV